MSKDLIRLPVIVIKVSNDDGTHNAGDHFSDDTIREMIEDTNAIFEPDAGIKLVLQEITSIKNTLINRLADWSMECPDAEATIPNPDPGFAAAGFKLTRCQDAAYDYAAKNYSDKIVVYVRRQTYRRVSVDSGCPKPIAGNWLGLPPAFENGIDAAFWRWSTSQIYLFKGSKYVRISNVSAGVDPEYPKQIAGNWPGLPEAFQKGIDAAFWRKSTSQIYFFKGSEYVRISNVSVGVDSGYPQPIASNWLGLPEAFKKGIDAAFWDEKTSQIYFFKGNEYVRFSDVAAGMDQGYPRLIKDNWPDMSKDFNKSIDAALWRVTDGKIYFFKNSEYVTFSKACEVVNESGGGFSHKDLNFIALSPWQPTGTLGVMVHGGGPIPGQAPRSYLAHELGHYFDLTHTMPNEWPQDQTGATKQLDEYCKLHFQKPEDVPDNLPDLVWDFDKLSDTPGDPGFDLYNQVLFGVDRFSLTATQNQCLGAGEFKVYSNFCGREFTVRPARQNVMSYTAQCPYYPGNTTGETRARISPQQRDIIHASLQKYRKTLKRLPAGNERYNAIWFKSSEDRPAVWAWKRADFDKKNAEYHAKGYRLAELNAFVLPDGQGERYNAIWVKSSDDRQALWAWKRADFDKKNSEYHAKGYRLTELNTFVSPSGQGERYNAIWVKSSDNRQALWAWKRADFDKKNSEYHAKGYRLAKINAFVLADGQGERYNAIWVKSNEKRPAVWAWKRADFDKKNSEYHAEGYRLAELNTFVLHSGQGELYNAIWVKSSEERPAVWAWVRWDFESRQSEHYAKGFRLHSLSSFVLP